MVPVSVATTPDLPQGKPGAISCRVFGHDWRFHAEGHDLLWDCRRCGTPGGMKHYEDPASATRYADGVRGRARTTGQALHALHDAAVAMAQAAPPLTVHIDPDDTDFASAIYGQVLAGSAVVALSRHEEPPMEIVAGVHRDDARLLGRPRLRRDGLARRVSQEGEARELRHLARARVADGAGGAPGGRGAHARGAGPVVARGGHHDRAGARRRGARRLGHGGGPARRAARRAARSSTGSAARPSVC